MPLNFSCKYFCYDWKLFQVWCSSSLNIKLWMCVIKGICLGPCINKHWGLTGIWVLGAENYKIFHCCPNKFWATTVRRRRCSRTTIFISLSPKNCPKGSHRGWKWKVKLTNGNYQPASCGAERGVEKGIYANTFGSGAVYLCFFPYFPSQFEQMCVVRYFLQKPHGEVSSGSPYKPFRQTLWFWGDNQ